MITLFGESIFRVDELFLEDIVAAMAEKNKEV